MSGTDVTTTAAPLRWGFLGCGKISSDYANAMKNVPAAILEACAARSLASAQEFAQAHGFARSYGSYEELVSDAAVDVIYIGTLHISHYEHTLLALEHGKHVVVEKPMTMNAREAAHAISVAKEKNLFLLEGMWTRFFPVVRAANDFITKQGLIGDVHHVTADIGFKFEPDNARMWERKLGGGGLLDIGIYPLAFVTMALGGKPEKVTAVGQLSEDGVDVYGSVTLQYSGNRFGTVQYSTLAQMQESVTIVGSKGRILIESPAHVATTMKLIQYKEDGSTSEQTVHYEPVKPHANSTPLHFGIGSVSFFYEIDAVTKAIQSKLTQTSEYPLEESLAIATIMDEIRKQLGVVYDADLK